MQLRNALVQLTAQLPKFVSGGGAIDAVAHTLGVAVVTILEQRSKFQFDLLDRKPRSSHKGQVQVQMRHGVAKKSA